MRAKHFVIAGLLLAGGGLVQADPVPSIGAWDFHTTTGFINDNLWGCDNGAGAGDNSCSLGFSNGNAVGTYDTLAWGTEANPADAQSYLAITNMIGTIITNGGWVDTNFFDHFNHIITSDGGNMTMVNVAGLFEITSPDYFPAGFIAPVAFDETFNQDSDACPEPNPNGSACDDFFTTLPLQGTSELFCELGGCYQLSFQFLAGPGTTVIFNSDGTISVYTTEACSADGQAGCGEGETYAPGFSRLIAQARIDFVVPEPTTVALLGIGLLGFALRRSRKNG